MEAKAKQTNIRMPARKIRRIINAVRGKSVDEAMKILKFMPYFAAEVVEKNLKCAVANAEEKWGINSEELILSEAYADEGPTYKRARPRAQGRMYKIMKRTSHLTIVVKVDEKLKEKLKEQKNKTKKAKTKPQTAKTEIKVSEKAEMQVQNKAEIIETKPVEEIQQETQINTTENVHQEVQSESNVEQVLEDNLENNEENK